MWENGNNSTGLPAMEVTTQNPLRELLKSKTVDAGKKTLCRKVRGSHIHGEESNVPTGSSAATPTCSPEIQMTTGLKT